MWLFFVVFGVSGVWAEFGYQSWVNEPLDIFPRVPIAAPNSSNPQCRKDSLLLLEGLRNRSTWALRMWDATPRTPDGVIFGSNTPLGNFDSCIRVREPIKSQYCMSMYTMNIPDTLMDNNTVFPYLRDHGIKIKAAAPRNQLYYGMCVPASCSADDMTTAINAHLKNSGNLIHPNVSYSIYVIGSSCSPGDEFDTLGSSEIAFWCMIAILITAGVVCSFLDSSNNDEKTIFDCLSARKNYKKLFTIKKVAENDPLYVFHGVKMAAMIGVYFSHKMLSIAWVSTSHQFSEESKLRFVGKMYSLLGDLPCDTFFFLTGALVAHSFYKSMHKPLINPLLIIFNRFIRLVPSYYLVVWMQMTAFNRIVNGPAWNLFYGFESKLCWDNWWTNFLLINNYYKQKEICMSSTWYVNCDLHMFVVAVLVALVLRRNEKIGLGFLTFVFVLSFASPGLTTYYKSLDPVFLHYFKFVMYPRNISAFTDRYISSHNRAAIYFLGMFYGILVYKQGGKRNQLALWWFWAGIAGALSALTAAYLILEPFLNVLPVTNGEAWIAAFGVSLRRPAWGLAVGLLLYVFYHRPVRAVNAVFESKFAVFMSRICYQIYLVHLSIIIARICSRRIGAMPSIFDTIMDSISDLVLVIILASGFYVFVDSPLNNILDKYLFGGGPKKRNTLEINKLKSEKEPKPTVSINGEQRTSL